MTNLDKLFQFHPKYLGDRRINCFIFPFPTSLLHCQLLSSEIELKVEENYKGGNIITTNTNVWQAVSARFKKCQLVKMPWPLLKNEMLVHLKSLEWEKHWTFVTCDKLNKETINNTPSSCYFLQCFVVLMEIL